MARERGARVLQVNSPLGSTTFNILRQFDMDYTHFKARFGEMNGISYEEGEKLMAEGRNSQTGKTVQIPARNVVKFKAEKLPFSSD